MPGRWNRWLRGTAQLERDLRGVPELDYFATDADRDRALDRLRYIGLWSRHGWPIWAVMATILVAGLCLLEPLLHTISYVLGVDEGKAVLVLILVQSPVIIAATRWAWRRGYKVPLRRILLDDGVPVCVGCGYLLRGLPADVARCPECGRPFEARVVAILSTAPAVAEMSES